eukprot:gene3512-13583_t
MSGSSDSEPLTSSDSFCNPQDVPMAAELRFANGSAARISEGLRSQSLLFDVSDLVTDNGKCYQLPPLPGDLLPATCFRLVQEDFLRCACPDLQQVQNALTKIIKLTGLLHLRVTEKTNGFEGLFEAALSNCLVSLMHLFDRDNFLHTTWFPSVMVEKISEAQQKWTPTVEELDSQMLAIENYIGVGGVKGCIQPQIASAPNIAQNCISPQYCPKLHQPQISSAPNIAPNCISPQYCPKLHQPQISSAPNIAPNCTSPKLHQPPILPQIASAPNTAPNCISPQYCPKLHQPKYDQAPILPQIALAPSTAPNCTSPQLHQPPILPPNCTSSQYCPKLHQPQLASAPILPQISSAPNIAPNCTSPKLHQPPILMYHIPPAFQCLKSAGSFSMPLIESVISIVARISPTLVSCFPDECDDLCEALEAFQRYVLHCIEHDREKLADNSRDRSFSCLSRVLEALFTACCALLLSEVLADKQVRDIQRAFVLQLLSSSNFNKLLSAGESLKDNVCWMNTTGLIKQMLRANLHQRQYADLVFQILEVLTRFSFIQEEHLDMLWAATEQEGTFDEIKVNVYQIIEDLAARGLPPEQLDTLFYKFEIGRERSLPDTLRLLDLLKKLAASDSKAPHIAERLLDMIWQLTMPTHVDAPPAPHMAERLLDMIWQLTMPTHVDAPPELLQSNVMPDVLRQYLVHGNITFIRHYVHRCVEQLRTKQGIYPALHLLRNLLNLIEEREDKELEETIGQLDVEFQIQSFLVGSLREFKQLSKRRMTERLPLCVSSKQLRQPTVGAAPPLPSSASGIAQHSFSPTSTAATPVAQLSSTPAGTAASSAAQHKAAVPPGTTVTTVTTTTDVSCLQRASAARPPGQGCYTYKQIVEEYMNVIQYIAMHHKNYFPRELALELWNLLVLEPLLPDDSAIGLSFFRNGNYFPRELALELWNLLVLEPLLPDDSAIGLSFFRNGVDPFSCTFMCPETQRELLCNHLTALNSGSLSKPAWDCFLSYFVTVNSEAKPPWLELSAQAELAQSVTAAMDSPFPPCPCCMSQLSAQAELAQSVTAAIDAQQYTVHRMDVLGLRYLWDVALNCARHDVSNHAGLHLIRLHQSPALEGAMATFLSECTHHMTSAVEAISKLDLSSDSSTGWSQLIQVAWKMTQEPHAPCAALEHCQQRAQRSLDLLVKMLDITREVCGPFVHWGTLLADGSTLLADGGTLLADGGTLLADGGALLADGGTLLADGGTPPAKSPALFGPVSENA